MSDDLSLQQFTAVDAASSVATYVAALEAFDGIPQLQELKALAWQRAGVGPGRHILDVGCGFGLETLRLARIVESPGLVAGVDRSAEFIAEARRRAATAHLDIDFRVADAAALPFVDSVFDVVRAERLLIYLDDVAAALGEMRRVAKPGGSLALIEPDFSTTTVNLANRNLARRVLAHEVDTAVAQSWLPGRLLELLAEQGFSEIDLATRVLVFPQVLAREYYSGMAGPAAAAGAITTDELAEWRREIEALAEAGRLFGTIGYFLFTGRA